MHRNYLRCGQHIYRRARVIGTRRGSKTVKPYSAADERTLSVKRERLSGFGRTAK